MRYENQYGDQIPARQAFHDAFLSNVNSPDFAPKVQGSGSDNDFRIMNHCDQGKIQNAIEKLRHKSLAAWAVGMHFWAPDGVVSHKITESIIVPVILFKTKTKVTQVTPLLARYALDHARIESVTYERKRYYHEDMAARLKISEEQYKADYLGLFNRFKDELHELGAKALAPVAHEISLIIARQAGEKNEVNFLLEGCEP